ncbi:hypothetical protein [Cytobacillus kochii]|uniref:hypothetical protein n=1 Tax=Cytobacillus kochii TaxID=859143 RepID=UPI0025A2BB4E|nr:hypothetical protein [Cytobacillus kochii]MDM5205321.1 hypothetical protein [Cytobacillus kochii]
MLKRYVIILGFLLFAINPIQTTKAESVPKAVGSYVTTEDIIFDLVFPTIDKRVIKEYGDGPLFGWNWKRIVGISYNDNHSYDVAIRIVIPDKNREDLVMVRISPSCNNEKLNKLKCNHDFMVEVLDYKHMSQ